MIVDKDYASLVKEARIAHAHYTGAFNETLAHISLAPRGSVTVLVGPTRVGKSSVVKEVLRHAFPEPERRGIRPCIYVDAATTERGFMSTKYLTIRALSALEHPFYTDDSQGLRLSQTESTARIHLTRALEHRGTKLMVVDEAHHLLRVMNRTHAASALDSLKCLGNETGVAILLSGGYELLRTCFESAHLNGRLSILEFPRYRPVEGEIEEFDSILLTFDQLLPWARGQSLVGMRDLIYEGSLGCCGLLSGWIVTALARMRARADLTLKREHFECTRFRQQIEPILEEIALGEGLLTPIRRGAERPDPPKRPRGSRKPGHRKPTRDPVGGDEP